VVDEIRRWSDELASDPASLVFLQLGEALRRQGQLDLAQRIALRGLERHPHNADAHDLLARISVDRGELERAFDEWDMVLRLLPAHVGAMKGMAYVCFQQGRTTDIWSAPPPWGAPAMPRLQPLWRIWDGRDRRRARLTGSGHP